MRPQLPPRLGVQGPTVIGLDCESRDGIGYVRPSPRTKVLMALRRMKTGARQSRCVTCRSNGCLQGVLGGDSPLDDNDKTDNNRPGKNPMQLIQIDWGRGAWIACGKRTRPDGNRARVCQQWQAANGGAFPQLQTLEWQSVMGQNGIISGAELHRKKV